MTTFYEFQKKFPDDEACLANTIDGYFSIFKRDMKGVYQHCAKKHSHRYMAEFDFRQEARRPHPIRQEGLNIDDGAIPPSAPAAKAA